MALAATSIHEVESGGSDTLNGGIFDPGQTAGMFTDGAATAANTSAPVFTSASYNFVAGDVGAKLFIGAGTNWTPGWYSIVSVSSNAATLSAAIGVAVGSTGATTSPVIPSTVLGCATVASPTGATWSIDYSQQAAAQFTYTDLISAGAGLTVSSAAFPFGKQQVGNSLVITGGTNFTTGRYVIASVSVGLVATVLGPGNITTGVGVSGTGGLGGAYASLGKVGAHIVGSNQVFIKTATYTVTSASTNVAAGCYSTALTSLNIEGYAAVRGDLNLLTASGTRPTVIASGISTFTLIDCGSGAANWVKNLIGDGAALTSSKGFVGTSTTVHNCHGQNFTNGFISSTPRAVRCTATGCSTVTAMAASSHWFCVAYANTFHGFGVGSCNNCLAYGNTGATTDGFSSTLAAQNCVSYGNGRDGFRIGNGAVFSNCVAEGNTGAAFTNTGTANFLTNCAHYSNTGGVGSQAGPHNVQASSFIVGTASFFTNAAAGDFSLNTQAGGGALLRGAGYPGVFPVGLTTGYLDVGAAQHGDFAGAGAMMFGGGGVSF